MIINVNAGLISLEWENPEILYNLFNNQVWDKHITKTNTKLAKDLCVELNNIYVENMGIANYTLKEGGKSILIVRPPIASDNQWWLNGYTASNDWVFLMSVDQDTRISIGEKLQVKFPGGKIPVHAMAEEAWWLARNNTNSEAVSNSVMNTQKIVDKLIRDSYTTLISRIAFDSE